MNGSSMHPAADFPKPAAAGAFALLGELWCVVADVVGWCRPAMRESRREAREGEALSGLSAHVLRDVGATSLCAADAAAHSPDIAQWGFDRRF